MAPLARPLAVAALGVALWFVLQSSTNVYALADPATEGAAVYAGTGCVHCHGAQGAGTELGPSLREVRKRRSPAELEQQILQGGKQMPAFGEVLDRTQVEELVAFLRAKHWMGGPSASRITPGL